MPTDGLPSASQGVNIKKRQPVREVLATPELLEMILLELRSDVAKPPDIAALKTLLVSQRVSKAFQACIRGSRGIREALWFERLSDGDQELRQRLGGKDGKITAVNPFFTQDEEGPLEINKFDIYEMALVDLTKDRGIAADGTCASWRRMLVVQGMYVTPWHCYINVLLRKGDAPYREHKIHMQTTAGKMLDTKAPYKSNDLKIPVMLAQWYNMQRGTKWKNSR